MKHGDFTIGTRFSNGARHYLCTDVGSRTIVAIRTDAVEVTRFSPTSGTLETTTEPLDEATRKGFFNGPPFGVVELVFDEYDLDDCEVIP